MDEKDELTLSPPKKRSVRAATPNSPRVVMECVEILTPSKTRPRIIVQHPIPASPAARAHTLDSSSPTCPPPKTPPKRGRHLQRKAKIVSDMPQVLVLAETLQQAPESEFNCSAPAARQPKASLRRKGKTAWKLPTSAEELPHTLPVELEPCLQLQKHAIMRSLRDLPDIVAQDDHVSANATAYEQLSNLLRGTVLRGEGNSCLLIGPRGSGKSRLVEKAIKSLPEKPIIIRLSGHAQHNDRLAIREIAWQLAQQTGRSFLPSESNSPSDVIDPDENPFLDSSETTIVLPPPAHLLALISVIPTLPRPTIIILDGFDLFAAHARQSLLYCLLDTAQSCRVGSGTKGIAIVGVTTRVDTINLLEKRVKSRFSGRMLRTSCLSELQQWVELARSALTAPVSEDVPEEWPPLWRVAVDSFLQHEKVIEEFKESFSLTRDARTLCRILTTVVMNLTPALPYPSAEKLAASTGIQRCPARFPFLASLPYPAICLCIAAVHYQTSGHNTFTFEMLHEAFRDQVRTSQSAPVQIEGGGIGMMRCSREVLAGAFERLATQRVFTPVAAPSLGTAKEFVFYRLVPDRFELKRAVEAMGQTNLKKWFSKA
ncbi:hypothetical protein CERSUDRAFT_111303 [Gelatoporia subvermispora B]|uniref:Origin recognition complex subunit 4 n=1 Tax=Ceriporiopsis subvermispora (strain B) TaxID=914234 RepID=M2PVD0_CERS8|nr:hypothetical protein CERSUDRAFT_111303 [Gelatoporia subvermispora B]